MTNTLYLEEVIKNSGLKKECLATALGITRQSLTNKINNKTMFNGAEIKVLMGILRLSNKDTMRIFFADDVH